MYKSTLPNETGCIHTNVVYLYKITLLDNKPAARPPCY